MEWARCPLLPQCRRLEPGHLKFQACSRPRRRTAGAPAANSTATLRTLRLPPGPASASWPGDAQRPWDALGAQLPPLSPPPRPPAPRPSNRRGMLGWLSLESSSTSRAMRQSHGSSDTLSAPRSERRKPLRSARWHRRRPGPARPSLAMLRLGCLGSAGACAPLGLAPSLSLAPREGQGAQAPIMS